MKRYIVSNDNDGNEHFTVEADNTEDALYKALEELGWRVTEDEEINED